MSTDMTGEALPADTIDPRLFAENLVNTSEWRRQQAQDMPHHTDLAEAVELLDRLAGEFAGLTDEELAPLSLAVGDYDYPVAETVNDYIGRIGFDHFPGSAKDFVHDLAAELMGEDA